MVYLPSNFTTKFNQILGKHTIIDGSYGARMHPRFLTGHAGAMILSHQPGNPHLTSIFFQDHCTQQSREESEMKCFTKKGCIVV